MGTPQNKLIESIDEFSEVIRDKIDEVIKHLLQKHNLEGCASHKELLEKGYVLIVDDPSTKFVPDPDKIGTYVSKSNITLYAVTKIDHAEVIVNGVVDMDVEEHK